MILGIVLLVITTSGAILVYKPEMNRLTHQDAYAASTGPQTVSFEKAREIVLAAHPDFTGTYVVHEHGVLRVTDYETSWTVDPSTGAILGEIGETAAWIQFLDNLHECLLACEDHPGYIAALNAEVPNTGALGYEGANVTYGGLILGIFGLILLYLSLTGIWLWFPRLGPFKKAQGRWKKSMNVRWNRGRFARDTDLHKVAGMLTIPLLLIWGVTGAGFEFTPVKTAWYAVTPGDPLPEIEAVSAEGEGEDISMTAAVDAAVKARPGFTVVAVDAPAADDATAAFTVWLASSLDPYGNSEYPGDIGVAVDRRTGTATPYYGVEGEPLAQSLWDAWNYPVHSGYVVNGWWKIIWFLFGMSPILLAVTGVSTWLIRHRSNRNRRRLRREKTSTLPAPA